MDKGLDTVNQMQKSGQAQKAIGVILLVLVGVIEMVLQADSDLEITGSMIPFLMLSMFLLTVGGVVLLWRGKQHAARWATPGILGDARPEVLYLRAFRSDTTTGKYVQKRNTRSSAHRSSLFWACNFRRQQRCGGSSGAFRGS